MNDNFKVLYNYFSNHVRNYTAIIATSVTLLSYRMASDEDVLISEIVDASFLLDLFDAGMNVCFNHALGEPASYIDEYSLEPMLAHFLDQCKSMLSERNITLELNAESPKVLNTHLYELRTLTNLVIYEMILQTVNRKLFINLNGNILTINSEGFCKAPEVWRIYKSVFASRGAKFTYSEGTCRLEYAV